MSDLKLGVVGAGFVGGSVINGFDTPNVQMHVVDPILADASYSISDLIEQKCHCVFVWVRCPNSATALRGYLPAVSSLHGLRWF